MKFTILILTLFVHGLSFAQSQQHDHDKFPEDTLLAFEGRDAITNDECFLFITGAGRAAVYEEGMNYVVETSYSHNGDKAPKILVKQDPKNPDYFTGEDAVTKSKIAIKAKDNETNELKNWDSFIIKWLHGNHYHSNKCIDLVVHED